MKKQLIWLGAAVLCATNLLAQSTDSVKAVPLDDVIITANKQPQKQSQTGKVVTVINREQINQNPTKNLSQLLQEQAGITINGALNNTGTNLTLYTRGSSLGRTLILIDGAPAYDPSLIGNEFDLNLLNLQQIERIEVARGAQSTLYGSDAVGGVINIITRPDNNKPIAADLMASYGSFNTFRGNANVYGTAKKWQYGVRYGKVSSQGFSSAKDKNNAGDFDNDGFNSDNLRADLGYQLTDHLSAKTFFQYNRYKTDVDGGIFRDDNDYTSANKSLMSGAQMQYRKKAFTLTANYFYNQTDRNLLDDSTDVSGFAKFTQNDFTGTSQFAELFANIVLGKGFSLLAGADYRYARMNSYLLSISSFGPYEDRFTDTSARQYSGYTSLVYNGTRFDAEAGIRYNNHSQYGGNTTLTFNPSFRISQHWRVFGSVASAFKVPSLYQLYSGFGNPDLQPETSVTTEAGIQQSHEKLSNRIVFFRRNIDEGIDFDYINFTYFNFNNQVVNGIEWETQWQPVKALNITANYTFLNPEETSQSRISNKDTTYSYLLRRPGHQINASVQWTAAQKLQAGITARYVSERYDVGGYQVPDLSLDDYFLLGVNLSYAFSKKLSAFANAQNLLDTEFVDINGYNSMPLNIQGGIRVKL